MQIFFQCHAWAGMVCRKHIYCSFVPHYLQDFKPLLQGRIVSSPIKHGRILLEAEAEETVFNETSLGLTLQWCILRPKSILTKTLDSSVEFKIQTLCSSSANE